jgi:hypothetical protein
VEVYTLCGNDCVNSHDRLNQNDCVDFDNRLNQR